MKNFISSNQAYFDCNATTPVLPIAAKAALDAMQTLYGNPSSSHLVGLQAKHILETTRKTAAQVIGSTPEDIIFTSGATEAIQTAIFSALQCIKNRKYTDSVRLFYSATEHKAIPEALNHWVHELNLPFEILQLPVDSLGQIKLDILRLEIPKIALLCTMAVNNETGVIQNLDLIEELILELNPHLLWLVDCVQGLGKIELNLNQRRIDYAPFSGHKLYSPKGIGFLYTRKNSPLTPLLAGGGQEKGFRSGTENLPGVAALGAVFEQLLKKKGESVFHSHEQLLSFRERLINELKRAFPKIEFNTPFDFAVPTTINFSVPGLTSGELLDLFDSAGLRLSAGSACSSTSVKPSHVLDAMGLPLWRSSSALRLSFGPCTSDEEISRGCKIIKECEAALKNTCLLDTAGAFEAPENLRDGILQFRAGSTNSWILADRETRSCIVIDPCETVSEKMEHYIQCQDLKVSAILDTHSHGDHLSIRPILQKILVDQMKQNNSHSDSLGWPYCPSDGITQVTLDQGEQVPAIIINSTPTGNLVLARLRTPGHTNDSQSFLWGYARSGHLKKEDIHFAFPGDTILSGGLGRTNFTMSDPVDLFKSLRNLRLVLSDSTLLCPTHDYTNSFATGLHTEIKENTLLALALSPMTPMTLEQFLIRKNQIDKELAQLEDNFQEIICGVTPTKKHNCNEQISLSSAQLSTFLTQKFPVPWVIDVREPQEFSLSKNWRKLGFPETPRNVPISRFVNLMSELLNTRIFHHKILLICRTGTRSLQAAKSLRRLGFAQAWNLEGGVALLPISQDTPTHV